jgi:snRNA-activating protein complex subunit 3
MLDNVDWNSKTRASSAIFLDDTIFIDRRNPDHVDYSEEILKFMEMHEGTLNRGQQVLTKTGDICETRFIDLELHLGLPYVFIHQGGCEHLIVVEQVSYTLVSWHVIKFYKTPFVYS